MPPQIDEMIVDRLSILDSGLVEITGRVAVSGPKAAAEPAVWLRLTKRGTAEHHLVSGRLDTVRSGHSSFRFELDLRNEIRSLGDDIFEAHLVLKSDEGEVVNRLSWPEAFNSWVAYPTIYGNLSVKRTTERQENE